MSEKKQNSLDKLIVALCADYERRKTAVNKKLVGRRVRMEYSYINSRMLEGAGEIAGAALAEVFIDEIGSGTGYAYSRIDCLGETTYKLYKKDIKEILSSYKPERKFFVRKKK